MHQLIYRLFMALMLQNLAQRRLKRETEIQSNKYFSMLWKLKNDKKFIFSASRDAQKATDYILNLKYEPEDMQQKVEVEVM